MPAKTLPFKVRPKQTNYVEIGDQECGILELPRYNDLTVKEKIFIDSEIKKLPDTDKALLQLVNTIVLNSGLSQETVWDMIQKNDTVQLVKADMEGLMTLRKMQDETRLLRRLVYASAMLIFRCPGCENLTMEEIKENRDITPGLLKALEKFCLKEMNRGLEIPDVDVEEATNVDEEKLKKIAPVSEELETVTTSKK